MFATAKIALAAALLAAASTAALAEYDFNLANRYPAYAEPVINVQPVHGGALQSAPVLLRPGSPYHDRRKRTSELYWGSPTQ